MRGNGLFLHKQYVVVTHGEEKSQEIINLMPEDTRKDMQSVILSANWYPVKTLQDYLGACEKVLGTEDLRKMARYAVEKQITGFFGFVLKFISLEKVFSDMDKMWKRYYSPGELQVVEASDNGCVIEIKGFPFTSSHLKGLTFWMEEFLVKITNKKVSCKSEIVEPEHIILTFRFFLLDQDQKG